MSLIIKKKNPYLAGFLSLAFGPIGYAYIGFNYFVAGLTITLIIGLVLWILNYPVPHFFNYLQLFIFAYYGYKITEIRNMFWANIFPKEEFEDFKSFSFAFLVMITVMMNIVRLYAFIYGILLVIQFFSEGRYIIALLMLILGIAFIMYFFEMIFGLISAAIMSIFKIDKKYL